MFEERLGERRAVSGMTGTKRFVEQRIIKRRETEARENDLRRRLVENNILAGHGKSEVRVEEMRRARSEAGERRELFMDYTFVKAEQDKARRTQIAQFEEHLADEIARRKATHHREEMDRKRICDGSEELRQLKEKLHMAKVNKERAQQLLDIETRKQQDHMADHVAAEYMENERLEQAEMEFKLNIEKAKQRERVKHINQQQIAQKEAQRVDALKEYDKDRAHVQALVDKIEKEDEDEKHAREEKKRETRVMLRQFMVEQQEKQRAMDAAEVEENERIEAYARMKREQEAELLRQKEEAEKEKQRLFKNMVMQMEGKRQQAEDLELLRNDLHREELEVASRKREEIQMRKKLEDREEMKNAYVFQMQMKERIAATARDEENKVREELMRKFAEDDRIEQMSEQRRRMKMEEHKREAQRLLELRRQMYEESRAAERQIDANLRADEGSRQVIIEEERKRLLREYGSDLKDFLPKGTLDSMADWDLLFKPTELAVTR